MNSRIVATSLALTMMATAGGPAFAADLATVGTVQDAAEPASADGESEAAFIPADFEAPVLVEAEGFKVVPLGPDLVDRDFDAYMSSIEHLQQTFTRSTSWPHKDISAADAMRDMETEQTRFQNRESFAYAVLTPDGSRERGCVYVYPSNVEGYDAVVRLWVTKAEYDAGFDAELYEWVRNWVAAKWPFDKVAYPGRTIDWERWDAMVAANREPAAS